MFVMLALRPVCLAWELMSRCVHGDSIPIGKWKSTAAVIKRLMDNPEDTAALHKRVMEWWRAWTVKWRLQLNANIERLVVANVGLAARRQPFHRHVSLTARFPEEVRH